MARVRVALAAVAVGMIGAGGTAVALTIPNLDFIAILGLRGELGVCVRSHCLQPVQSTGMVAPHRAMPAEQRELLARLLSPELKEVVSPAERQILSQALERGDPLNAEAVSELRAMLRDKQAQLAQRLAAAKAEAERQRQAELAAAEAQRQPEAERQAEAERRRQAQLAAAEAERQRQAAEAAQALAEEEREAEATAATSEVLASRIFAGPSQYPPGDFTAYGILAFRSRSSEHDYARHKMICEAYVSSLPHASELGTRRSKQMATIWPISSDLRATELNAMPSIRICDSAVRNYGLVTALKAIKDAQTAGASLSNDGPFLLAWSPSDTKGEGDALVLVSDLSGVTTFPQARSIMLRWSRDIERSPELWDDGWDVEKVRLAVRLWVDEYGPKVLALFGAQE